ncbi:hypothetical protein FIBSPDRAFT_754181 [Athelia psychrophila]|uniref:rRNA-processing protein EFG1 n=1 Tax=Athelia psychrophila TaxID=1759441 RepID=A0A166BVE8_9AGAM|nr:hypothetical protein FIBSPDRAFT_754181 [Fibularhizoctonia sp. CBS 109695]
MPAIRTEKPSKVGESSSAPQKVKSKRKYQPKDTHESGVLPGVQKLKAALRQTRRLLAKDKLAADVRVETERRMKALEADIAQAESSRTERTMSVKYHKVKFFERQKVVRKISQATKKLSSDELSPKSKKKTEAELHELRVDLNYILHYPKAKKYISLFPPEKRQEGSEASSSTADAGKTDAQREEVRTWIRQRMQDGELDAEPELHLDAKNTADTGKKAQTEWVSPSELGSVKTAKKVKSKVEKPAEKPESGGVEGDAFFGNDDEDEDEVAPGHDRDSEDDDEDESD